MREVTGTEARVLWLACKAANAAQLSACYREEGEGYQRQARALEWEREFDWSVDPDGHGRSGLPDNWMSIAEMEEPPTSMVVPQAVTP